LRPCALTACDGRELQAAIDESQHNVTGTVRCKLYKGNVIIEGRKSPYTIYNANLSTFGTRHPFIELMS